ncbi:hypothetical protein SLA2020_504940 [Shorea laevis]
MASSHSLSFTFFLCFLLLISQSQSTFGPNRFVLPVHKDSKTSLYVTNISKRTPLLEIPLVVDLNGRFLWVTCNKNYLSSTYHVPLCHSIQCARANSHRCIACSPTAHPGCHNNACGLILENPVTRQNAMGELAEDVLAIQSTQGSNLGAMATIPSFLFACAPSFLLQNGFPRDVQGVVGLGHGPISLPTQLSSHFGFPPTFSLCLSDNGVIFFGNAPYYMQPGVDVSRSLGYTPLTITRKGEYFIEVRSIQINNKLLPLMNNPTIRTKICTTLPYTVLEQSIFKIFTQFFTKEIRTAQVKPVYPFEFCYESSKLSRSRVGLGVPNIDLVTQKGVIWRIFGANSMVEPKPGVACLAFVDGGLQKNSPGDSGASIVIGAYQLENNLVEFDLQRSRLGFSSSLLFHKTSCSNFNFTTSA